MTHRTTEPPTMSPAKAKAALRHGMRSARLPKACKYIERGCERLRAQLEAALGQTTIHQAALISSALRHEKRAALAERWLRQNMDSLPLAERLQLLAAISGATDARDRTIAALKIDMLQIDPWSVTPSRRLAAEDASGRAPSVRDDSDATDAVAEASCDDLEDELQAPVVDAPDTVSGACASQDAPHP